MAKTINIRGSSVSIVTATNQSTGGTAIGNVVDDLELPNVAYTRRNVTGLADLVQKFRVSKLATLEGELAFNMHIMGDLGQSELAGEEKIVRVDIPTDEATATNATQFVQVFCPVAFASEEVDTGDDENDVVVRVHGLPMSKPVWTTATKTTA